MSQGETISSTFKCDICNTVFSQRKNLMRHNRSFHEGRTFDIKVVTKSGQPATFKVEPEEVPEEEAVQEEEEVYEVVTEDADEVAEEQPWEDDGVDVHFCTACNINITSVVDHVAEFHPHQTIYYETGGDDEDDREVNEIQTASHAEEDDEHCEVEYLEEEEEIDTTTSEPPATENKPSTTSNAKTNVLKEKLSKSPVKKDVVAETAKPVKKYSRLPKIIGTLGKTNEVDPVSGVQYVRKMMKIEKFWEDLSFELPPIRGEGKKVPRKRPIKTNTTPIIKVTNKSEMDEIAEAVSSGHVTVIEEPVQESDQDAREAIIRILQDDTTEDMAVVYVCQTCGLEFSTINSVKTHKCNHKKFPIRLTCDVCGLKCKSQRRLQIHENTHDPYYKEKQQMKRLEKRYSTAPIVCTECNTQFSTEVGYRMHRKMHRPDNVQKVAEMNNKVEYRCDLCQMTCYSERTLRIHYKVHFPTSEPSVEELRSRVTFTTPGTLHACRLCFTAFEDPIALRDHVASHEVTVETGDVATEETVISVQLDTPTEYFTCEECGNVLAESYREMHEKMHRGELHYICQVCNRKFPCAEHLELHERIHEPKELECGQCRRKFDDQAQLAAHVVKHAATERPYACGFCGKCFSRPHEKVKHERVHTGEQPYECSICGMRFRVAYCLRMHERIHTGVRPYSCDYCEKTFRTRSGYKQHVSIHSDLRLYQCKFCPKSFKTIVQLAGHRKSHTKPYVCTECSRRFATSYMLRAHMAAHANDAASNLKHKCTECGASYGREYALRDHLKAAHGKVVASNKRKAAQMEELEASSNDNDSSQEAVYLAVE